MARNIQTELSMIANLLQRRNVCKDVTPILRAIPKIGRNGSGPCKIEKLEITLPKPANMRPNNIIRLVAIITVETDGKHVNEADIDHMFNNYLFNVIFMGYGQGKEEYYYSSIHLDYESSNSSGYIHPCFHLTYGGLGVKNIDHGQLMVLPVPRIPIWPMDFILGLDFILSNFLNKEEYKGLIADSYYRSALRKSQDSIWRPYILAVAHHWCKFTNCKYNMIDNALSLNYIPTLIQ
ncbi:MAG: hypothetical protein NC548_30220 [Lachnospiraceae bacterium]|nr:hypothetical protein [Lachnospiraceae bacterium]